MCASDSGVSSQNEDRGLVLRFGLCPSFSSALQASDSINVELPGARLGAVEGRLRQVESTFEEETHLSQSTSHL